ncbi:MAG: HIRAN domain-containing protein [Stygiobacter sp.]|jgi:hypothetical protein
MKRIEFIKSSIFSAFGLMLPKWKDSSKRIFLSKFYIAGFTYYDGDEVIDKLKVNDELKIVAEPENPYDRRALAIYTSNNKKLGYVPRVENPIPSRINRQNYKLTAEIEKINYKEDDYRKVRVKLFMVVNSK